MASELPRRRLRWLGLARGDGMPDLALSRPGPAVGHYPEREDERVGGLDRAMAVVSGWFRQRYVRRRWHGAGFLKRVARAEKQLTGLSDSALGEHCAALRNSLRIRGLEPDLVARSFALVRVLSERRLGMRHFDVQVLGARIMLKGGIAEMETGEGKTLTATLPAATAALAGAPVHVITVNDFLAERDADWMRPLYEALGLTVGVILEGMGPDERRRAYACDIVYCTNKQIAFDYLKDRLVLDSENRALHMRVERLISAEPRMDRVMMRGLCFAIVDEADSCLVDEARTPLIISRAGDMSGLEQTCVNAMSLARRLESPRDYVVHPRERRIQVTDLGKTRARRLSESWGGVWAAEGHRDELVRQALSALHLYLRDVHYIVRDGAVAIVDEYTGRIMADRSWERGLHQMIEVKEGVEMTGRHETLARISYQRFFRRYHHLCGMTGTAQEVSGELWSVYGLTVRKVAPNKPSRRRDLGSRIYSTQSRKWEAVVRLAGQLHAEGRPLLIGTRSVAASAEISNSLATHDLSHRVLSALQDSHEAEIVAQAGQRGQITVATNMAGRGTDITLGQGVAALGGLFVFATEPHDAGRIDRQLYGRCARQGDPGSHILFASIEDELMRQVYGKRLDGLARLLASRDGRVPALVFKPLIRFAQRSAERRNSSIRRSLLQHDDSMDDLLAFSGRAE